MPSSSIPKFFEKTRAERLGIIRDFAELSDEEVRLLELGGGIGFEQADRMVENALGTFALPLGVATNFRINGRDYLVPMAIEEPSVIAAASKAAKLARPGGFTAAADRSYVTGQVQVLGADDGAIARIGENAGRILDLANSKSRTLSATGRGAREVNCRTLETDSEPMLIVELTVDAGDAMGANVTNTMCEAVAPLVEDISGGRALLRILSNYSGRRMARASAVFDAESVGGERTVDDMVRAYQFAKHDVYRAVTHNKGIMNGMIAVANATGQDGRAMEAAAHAHAARSGRYGSLSEWKKDADGNLAGYLEVPLAVGIVGGVVNVHPLARICAKILGAGSAGELACVIAAAGLAQNFAAMRALVTDGIQKGHMRLHARNLASAAGAAGGQVDRIASQMAAEGNISLDRAGEIFKQDRDSEG